MPGSKAVRERIEQLISEGNEPPAMGGAASDKMAWLIAAQSVVPLVCPSNSNAYHVHAQHLVNQSRNLLEESIEDMAALLTRLLEEIDRGLLTTIENHAITVTFDDSSTMAPSISNGAERTRPPSSRASYSRTP